MQATIIEEAINTARTDAPLIISHVGTEASEEFIPFVAEPHLSLAVRAKMIAGLNVSKMCAAFIVNLSL